MVRASPDVSSSKDTDPREQGPALMTLFNMMSLF